MGIYGYRHERHRSGMLEYRVIAAAEADEAICHDCAASGEHYAPGQEVDLHHIVPIRVSPDRQYDPENCVFLCRRHHAQAERRLRQA